MLEKLFHFTLICGIIIAISVSIAQESGGSGDMFVIVAILTSVYYILGMIIMISTKKTPVEFFTSTALFNPKKLFNSIASKNADVRRKQYENEILRLKTLAENSVITTEEFIDRVSKIKESLDKL